MIAFCSQIIHQTYYIPAHSASSLAQINNRVSTMAAEQRKLLEQLMGASVTSQAAKPSFSDPKLCRSYIAGTCPHILFTNTKQDLGPCPKIHSEALKTEYDAMSEREKSKLGFEYDYIRHLYQYIDECNRGIEAAQRRLKKTPEEIRQTNVMVSILQPSCAKATRVCC